MSYPFSGFRHVLEVPRAGRQAEHFQAKRNRLAARKMRPEKAFSSQAVSLGGSENATRQKQEAVWPRAKAGKRL
jgi:hypothetical protein